MVDEGTKRSLALIPLLKTKAGPRDGELWVQRLKEEYQALITVSERYCTITALLIDYVTVNCIPQSTYDEQCSCFSLYFASFVSVKF